MADVYGMVVCTSSAFTGPRGFAATYHQVEVCFAGLTSGQELQGKRTMTSKSIAK